jgi:hypothetical protein
VPEVPDLARLDQFLYGARYVPDRDFRVDPVLVEKVNGLHLQTPERSFDRPPYGLGTTIPGDGPVALVP